MICRLIGRVEAVHEEGAVLSAGPLWYELLLPRSAVPELQRVLGTEISLLTFHYLEGSPAMGNLLPRLVGFLNETERDFFHALLHVKGFGVRKALRAMAIPAHQIALAIENADERVLATLPEIGKRTASQVVAQLRGKLARFLTPAALAAAGLAAPGATAPPATLTQAQCLALDILVHWGDRRADAERWLAEAVAADPSLTEPDALVRAAYRLKTSAGR